MCLPMPATDDPVAAAARDPDLFSLDGLRVLLVEDEPFVAEVLARALIGAGAAIEMTDDAESALAWLKTNAPNCDVVISDHSMPGLTGLEMLEQVRAQYPRIRRVLLSGWGAVAPNGTSPDAAELMLSK